MHKLSRRDVLAGGFFFAAGDSIGALFVNEFLYARLAGMLVLGASLYAWEIPAYFNYLARRFAKPGHASALQRMLFSALFFNPLWIARHILFIQLFSGQWEAVSVDILATAGESFVYCFPISLLVNYLIQNVFALQWRFFISSFYSALTAIYFALSDVFLG